MRGIGLWWRGLKTDCKYKGKTCMISKDDILRLKYEMSILNLLFIHEDPFLVITIWENKPRKMKFCQMMRSTDDEKYCDFQQ